MKIDAREKLEEILSEELAKSIDEQIFEGLKSIGRRDKLVEETKKNIKIVIRKKRLDSI